MNIGDYPEIKPGMKSLKRIYLTVMFFVMGRAIQAAYRVDKTVKREFDALRKDFIFCFGVLPKGPNIIIGKNSKGKIKYLGGNTVGKKITLRMSLKNIEAAMLLFTFRESTAVAFAHNRMTVTGDIPDACVVARVFDIVETFILPKIIVKLAVKRYPKWSQMSPLRKWLGRFLIYVRAFSV